MQKKKQAFKMSDVHYTSIVAKRVFDIIAISIENVQSNESLTLFVVGFFGKLITLKI